MRDVYTHRKGFPSPLLVLEFLDQEFAFNKRQSQVELPNCARLLEINSKKICSCQVDQLSVISMTTENDNVPTRICGNVLHKDIPHY